MQSSAVPELAHTHARPIHWMATATAVAGVVALSSVLQPDPATAAAPGAPAHEERPGAGRCRPTRPTSSSRSTAAPSRWW